MNDFEKMINTLKESICSPAKQYVKTSSVLNKIDKWAEKNKDICLMLPCKLGSTVYKIDSLYECYVGEPTHSVLSAIFALNDIVNKTEIFLTKKDAMQKIKEMKKISK